MELFEQIVNWLEYVVWEWGIPAEWLGLSGHQTIPIVVIILVGVGIWLTLRLSFVQIRHFAHGLAVTTGRYDDPDEPGDVSHFQALTTALSATVGIGNIAGVAIAIHWGGPGALFWMWVTAFLGMATKFTEVTLAQEYRDYYKHDEDDSTHAKLLGTVSGGPMYYIQKGLGENWKWMAVLFATLLGIVAFFTGNAVQANTVADVMSGNFGIAVWITGLVTATIVAVVVLGGITRIGRVTSILAPAMAAIYVLGGLLILVFNYESILPTLGLIFKEAFNPTAGIAGTGVGAFLVTLMWGVRRGLFSNEAGQGSAPIAHSAAQTDEPISEGVVALLEPFIDTIVICSITGLAIIMTGVWQDSYPSVLDLDSGDASYVQVDEATGTLNRMEKTEVAGPITIDDGVAIAKEGQQTEFAWYEVAVPRLFTACSGICQEDTDLSQPFTGKLYPARGVAVAQDGTEYHTLYGQAVENGAPLTVLAFERGLGPISEGGGYIVILCVLLFAVSTAISWNYYGNRCALYLFGEKAILPYNLVYVLMHFIGAVTALSVIWNLGDIFLGLVILPNLLALVLLSGKVRKKMRSYFERKPWLENYEVHKRIVEEKKHKHKGGDHE